MGSENKSVKLFLNFSNKFVTYKIIKPHMISKIRSEMQRKLGMRIALIKALQSF